MFVHCYAWKIAVEVAIVGIIVWFGLQPWERRDRAEWNGTSSHFNLEGRAGSEKYRMEVRPTYIDLVCADCGARLRIDAATDEDLDRLCCNWTLTIKGRR